MARPAYTTRFLDGSVADTVEVFSYVVPAGFRAVLRDLDVSMASGTGGVLLLSLAGFVLYQTPQLSASTAPNASWRGRQAANAGETIAVEALASSGVLDFSLTGYLLTA